MRKVVVCLLGEIGAGCAAGNRFVDMASIQLGTFHLHITIRCILMIRHSSVSERPPSIVLELCSNSVCLFVFFVRIVFLHKVVGCQLSRVSSILSLLLLHPGRLM